MARGRIRCLGALDQARCSPCTNRLIEGLRDVVNGVETTAFPAQRCDDVPTDLLAVTRAIADGRLVVCTKLRRDALVGR